MTKEKTLYDVVIASLILYSRHVGFFLFLQNVRKPLKLTQKISTQQRNAYKKSLKF